MPTYDYECKKCNHKFEVFQSIKDKALSECPECKGEVRRLIGGGLGVIFKGNGFYTTDNKKSSTPSSSSPAKDKTPKPVEAKESASPTESKSSGEGTNKESTKSTNKKESLAS